MVCLWRQDVGCLLWVWPLTYVLPPSLQCCMQYYVVLDCVITAPSCVSQLCGPKKQWLLPWYSSVSIFSSLCPGYIDGLVQNCHNSSALAMELLQSCTKSSICLYHSWCKYLWFTSNPFVISTCPKWFVRKQPIMPFNTFSVESQ